MATTKYGLYSSEPLQYAEGVFDKMHREEGEGYYTPSAIKARILAEEKRQERYSLFEANVVRWREADSRLTHQEAVSLASNTRNGYGQTGYELLNVGRAEKGTPLL